MMIPLTPASLSLSALSAKNNGNGVMYMTRKEGQALAKQMQDVFSGILFQHQEFEMGETTKIIYDFQCPEFDELREKYDLLKIAGKGGDFTRAKRLLHYLAPRLTHASWYDNHIECNALRLLEYSLDNPAQGINCLNKSKILVECCLAVGIYARRVSIMPFSPYDFDNHVVVEIYDRALEKWIMLDPTTDGYFVDEERVPLSLLEMRDKFANAKFLTFVRTLDSLKDIQKLREKYVQTNMYICKNLFYFKVERYATFGEKGEYLHCVPVHYSVEGTVMANLQYRIDNLPAEYEDHRKRIQQRMAQMKSTPEPTRSNIESMLNNPI